MGVSVVELEEVMAILELHRQGLSISAIAAQTEYGPQDRWPYERGQVSPGPQHYAARGPCYLR